MRLTVASGLSDWWDAALLSGPLELSLHWRAHALLKVGTLHSDRMLVDFDPSPADLTEGAERVGRLLGKAFTRAGWRRPALDPAALLRLLELRRGQERIEFILDTNALVEGVAHWLVDHFADRCDLVVTAVTLRELQDANGRAKWGDHSAANGKAKECSKVLGARQLYLAAHRLRERTGYPRVLWRELEIDDTALLLSRGHGGDKGSESDTLLLRAVRRSIHDRVNNLERFFVTGDTALARRASTELPVGSVLPAQVQPVDVGEVLFPCSWWPGPDQGLRVVRHPARLVWELLCVADRVVLQEPEGGRAWSFQAFSDPMWPTDYLEPWVDVTGPETERPGIRSSTTSVDVTDIPPSVSETRSDDPFWPPAPEATNLLAANLRVPARAVMELLAALALDAGGEVAVPAAVFQTSASKGHVRTLVETLGLGTMNDDATVMVPGPRVGALRDAWQNHDLDQVFDLVRTWSPLDEWATLEEPSRRPDTTTQIARALAALLGQGMYHPGTGQWVRGGLRPSVSEMRAAVLDAVRSEGSGALSVYRLLVDVFLVRLGVSPARVQRRWADLWQAGVFHRFEAREGGTSSDSRTQEVALLGEAGWSTTKEDLESIAGVRDLVFRGVA